MQIMSLLSCLIDVKTTVQTQIVVGHYISMILVGVGHYDEIYTFEHGYEISPHEYMWFSDLMVNLHYYPGSFRIGVMNICQIMDQS